MNKRQIALQNNWLYLFIGIAVLINFSALFIPVTGPDGALYALIAKAMVQRNNYVELFYNSADWLDKPHFPFWITAFSFKLFGFTTWAYKLPGILFLMMGAVYTYQFAQSLYNKQVALWSVAILLTAQHIILSNNDVRAEPYLTGLIIAGVYHLYKANANKSYLHLVLGCVFAACAIMTKGMFAIIPIGGAIAGHLIITRHWKQLFNVRWLVAIVLTLLFILPELWCLYQQFDLHPEKIIFGQQHVSGIRFFFWDSQFGRFFNTGPIKGSGDPSFFVHTALWAFLPWSLLMFAAIFQFIKKGIKYPQGKEWYCISGALLTFLLFSASSFQLPHYLNIVFPFFAIITAQYLYYITTEKTIRAIGITQAVIISLMLVVIGALQYFFRPEAFNRYIAVTIIMLLLLMLVLPGVAGAYGFKKIAYRSLIASFIVNVYLNLAFYPSLIKYQAGSEAAIWINNNNPKNLPVAEWDQDNAAPFEFYSNKPLIALNADGKSAMPSKPFIIYAQADQLQSLNAQGLHVQPLATFKRYWVTRLTPKFLNKSTRDTELTQMVVAEVK
jgi:4-amino-4-deoxy-L-arabinose transferase-like glycosyltransferase